MPWYWIDELARILVSHGTLSEFAAAQMVAVPVAIRREEMTIEDAAHGLLEDDEIPLAT